ncbi:MAG: 9-O-acetylesterase [Planctomycetia bacterium]|nr:9-O-acetylesterase [Planctomycetia bacterium]
MPVWGMADAGEKVTVSFGGKDFTVVAGPDGQWRVQFDSMPASSEPRDMVIRGESGEPVTLTDILVGDVWLCSGQSNMGWNVESSLNPAEDIATANYPALRQFRAAERSSLTPVSEVKGNWERCSPQTVGKFSGVGYFFARELHKDLDVPIGIFISAVGATPAEAWTRLEALQKLPDIGQRAAAEIAKIQSQQEDNRRFLVERAAWEEKHGVTPPPVAEAAKGWAAPDLDTGDWQAVTFPGQWKNFGLKSGGVFWIRKEFDLPAEALKHPHIIIGLNWASEQYDTVFLNGEKVAELVEKPPTFYTAQRTYYVPVRFAKPGRNVVAVRFVAATEHTGMHQWGKGVFPFAGLKDIDNHWLMKVESTFPRLPSEALASRPKPNGLNSRAVSSSLYNGMIVPLMPMAIKGVIWYQGESNVTRPKEYRDLLSALIEDWRERWGQGDFPFYIVQLANYYGAPKEPADSGVARVREGQLQVAQNVPGTGLAVAIDIGEESIHPRNKQDVGKRLALQALHHTYGRAVTCNGPIYRGMAVEGDTVRLSFDHVAGGLIAKNGPLTWFAIAGDDKKFVWADAKIDGETVVVTSSQVPEPVAVRFAWADNPEGFNLYNAAGLPMSPFRTDDWPVSGDSGKSQP